MIEKMDSVVNAISNFLYSGPEKLPIPFVIVFLICGGLYFTIRSKAVQFRLFGESIRVVSEKPKGENSVSSFGALMVSTASRVGTGNIIGVSTAICLGGMGSEIGRAHV